MEPNQYPGTPGAEAVQAIAQLARDGQRCSKEVVAGTPVAHFPGTRELASLEQFMQTPLRKRVVAELMSLESFVDYVAKYREPGTALFADFTERGGRVLAVIDYHLAGIDNVAAEAVVATHARWGDHRVLLTLKPSPEWARWVARSGELLTQTEFAEFLEENAADVVTDPDDPKSPDSARIMEVALTLQAKNEVKFRSAIRLQNGQTQIQYHEEISATAGQDGTMDVPQQFCLSLRPFVGTQPFRVTARLKYSIRDGKLVFRYELARLHRLVEEVCREAKAEIEEKLDGITVWLGSLESMSGKCAEQRVGQTTAQTGGLRR